MQKCPLLNQLPRPIVFCCILFVGSINAELVQLVLKVLCTGCQAGLPHKLDLKVQGTIRLQKWHNLVLWKTEQLKGPPFLSLDGHDLFLADRDPLYIAPMINHLRTELEPEDLNSG